VANVQEIETPVGKGNRSPGRAVGADALGQLLTRQNFTH
jgi:hypothetical protein